MYSHGILKALVIGAMGMLSGCRSMDEGDGMTRVHGVENVSRALLESGRLSVGKKDWMFGSPSFAYRVMDFRSQENVSVFVRLPPLPKINAIYEMRLAIPYEYRNYFKAANGHAVLYLHNGDYVGGGAADFKNLIISNGIYHEGILLYAMDWVQYLNRDEGHDLWISFQYHGEAIDTDMPMHLFLTAGGGK